ncbi:PH domain-containing protein [Streptomyces sp. YIM 98790]|uniref:PH domain-containing protein n=1 Tax=Streptomyces sp. YIM 98790 TaxID=2689077 RepID=UPI00140E7380|nr:PH domain-containing protein [Streptomyces sp. YIM 98790]
MEAVAPAGADGTDGGAGSTGGADGATPGEAGETGGAREWRHVQPGLLTLWRVLLVVWTAPVILVAALLPLLLGAPEWSLPALLPLALMVWGWVVLGRVCRSWRYLERADDLLISRGVMWKQLTVVPYGRMQLVEVTSGPLDRKFSLARLQLHTAAAATDATIPGLAPDEAERLRDRLTELGEARSAGL